MPKYKKKKFNSGLLKVILAYAIAKEIHKKAEKNIAKIQKKDNPTYGL